MILGISLTGLSPSGCPRIEILSHGTSLLPRGAPPAPLLLHSYAIAILSGESLCAAPILSLSLVFLCSAPGNSVLPPFTDVSLPPSN